MSKITFLSLEDVYLLHSLQIDHYGGSEGVRDHTLVESAAMTPQGSYGGEFTHPDIFLMAAAYAFHLSENQAFVDGNKRTALSAALVFLDINGIEIVDPEGSLYQAMIDVSAKKLDKAGLANLLKKLNGST